MDVTTTLRHHEQTTVSAKLQLYQEMTKPERVASIDVLRGAAMIFMALNHTQISFSPQTFGDSSASKLPGCSSSLLAGSLIFCAPVFVFLAGVEAYLQLTRGKTKRHLSLVFNSTTFGSPDSNINDNNFGQITTLRTGAVPRVLQFGFKGYF